MTDPIRLTLDVPPSANRYWRIWKGRAVRTSEATAYHSKALVHARNRGILPLPQSARVCLTIHWFRARKQGDVDNRIKVCADALQGVAYHNDSQVVELHAYRHEDPERPRVEVEVRAVA